MFAEVGYGMVDTSSASFDVTLERVEFADFASTVFHGSMGLIVLQPDDADFSVHPHTLELLTTTWMVIAIAYIMLIALSLSCVFIVKISNIDNETDHKRLNLVNDTFAFCLRAFIGKVVIVHDQNGKFEANHLFKGYGNGIKSKSRGLKVLLFSILLLGMFNLIAYRCMLNASLNVKFYQLPINSWEDIVHSDFDVMIWQGGAVDSMLTNSPPGSVMQKIYEEKIKHSDVLNGFSTKEAIGKVLDGSSIIFDYLGTYKEMPEYPCKIIDVPHLK